MNCIFCSIIHSKDSFIYQDEHCVVIEDKYPDAPIHYLIIPKKHIANIKHATIADNTYMSTIFSTAQLLSTLIGASYDFKLLTNNGIAAGQVVLHMHTHFMAYPSKDVS